MEFLLSPESLSGRPSINSMLQLIDRQGEFYLKGLDEGRKINVSARDARISVFYGLGGSGIVGQLASTIYQNHAKTPLLTYTTASMPSWVGRDSFVVLLSYSGETYEALTALRQVIAKGAAAVAVCSGGSLDRLARENGLPVVNVSKGLTPRMAVPEMLGVVTAILDSAGLTERAEETLQTSLKTLEKIRASFSVHSDISANTAKKAALMLLNRLPHAVSESTLLPVALRLKNQLNENAKRPCIVIDIPEAMHNTLEALPYTRRDKYILYRWTGEDRAVAVQLDFLKRFLGGKVFEARFDGSLAETVITAVAWSDYVSIYLAALENVDPLPVSKISALRRELEKLKT